MYWVAGFVVILYLLLFLLSRREKKGKAPPGIEGWFYPISIFLYRLACRCNVPVVCSEQVQKDLKSLHPEGELQQLQEEYYVKKISLSLLLCMAGTLLGAAVTYTGESNRQIEAGVVSRGSYTEGTKEVEVSAILPSGEETQLQVTVYPRELSMEEADALYQEFIEVLPDRILGKNTSLMQVWEELELFDSYEGYPFAVEWKSSRPDVLSGTGIVYEVEEPVDILLSAMVSYGEQIWQQEIAMVIIPPILSEEAAIQQEITELLEASESSNRSEGQWELPIIYRGETVSWKEIVQDNGPLFFGGMILIAVVVFLMSDKDLHDELLKKKENRKRLYPEIVQKLLLYLGAGMTVRAAFYKMAPEYEEISYMCRELQAGVSEGSAYEHWGKRMGIQEYLRLSTLLSQNLKKGNGTLLQRLREEAERACAEQLQNSRKLAEEATTKLLLPMILLLLVVMLIIMLPAFSSMGM